MNAWGVRKARGQYKSHIDPLLVELNKPQFVCKHEKVSLRGFPGDWEKVCSVCRKKL